MPIGDEVNHDLEGEGGGGRYLGQGLCSSRRKNGCSQLDVRGEAGLQRVFEEKSTAEVRGAARCVHLMCAFNVYI